MDVKLGPKRLTWDHLIVVNFIQQPLPEGSTTGAVTDLAPDQAGALGMGQRASTGLTMCKYPPLLVDEDPWSGILTHNQ